MLLVAAPSLFAQSYFDDDIYYNPAKDKSANAAKENAQKKKKQSNYIADYSNIDVDTYNRRDLQYYSSPVDTIGQGVENGQDFVYTQEIQKYYDPTIVVENADVLADVLANSYGNVEIVLNTNGVPVFAPVYSYYSWPYYRNWGLSVGPWGWNVGFYDPWYAWNWGPAWSWSWNWGPAWAWGPSWGWGWGYPVYPARPVATWSPNGNRPVGSHSGWTNGRPGNRTPIGGGTRRPASTARPGSTHAGVVNNNGRWEYVNNRGNRTPIGGGSYNGSSTSGNRYQGTTGSGSRPANNNGTVNSNRGNRTSNSSTSNQNYNSGNSNNRSFNSTRSYGTGRSSGGSYGGGSRGTVGGGSRGGRGGRR